MWRLTRSLKRRLVWDLDNFLNFGKYNNIIYYIVFFEIMNMRVFWANHSRLHFLVFSESLFESPPPPEMLPYWRKKLPRTWASLKTLWVMIRASLRFTITISIIKDLSRNSVFFESVEKPYFWFNRKTLCAIHCIPLLPLPQFGSVMAIVKKLEPHLSPNPLAAAGHVFKLLVALLSVGFTGGFMIEKWTSFFAVQV